MTDAITLPDGRSLAYADFGAGDDTPVIWCHGGPGNRREPDAVAGVAGALGFRLIGLDRPGYGGSTADPGRTIGGWVADALALADHLQLERFMTVGVSTGGAYALALAAATPRVSAAVACCAVSDMRWAEGKAMMAATAAIWAAPDRAAALAIAEAGFGPHGERMADLLDPGVLPASDLAILTDPLFAAGMVTGARLSFAQGVAGYADDRIADGVGWGSFDLTAITCPVVVLHGQADSIVPVAHARHTAGLVPGAVLDLRRDLGHFSIIGAVPDVLAALRADFVD